MGDAVAMEAVETTQGRVAGLSRSGHQAFYGIPYAAPPTGALRFRPPAPALRWTGVRQATERGFAALQTAHFVPGFAASGPQDEDCLNLNVFTPAADGARRPVLFWIHGGGFTHGAGYEDLYDGGPLAVRGDVVVVSLNYRLGALGFLHVPEAGFGPNCGLLDLVAGLEWVRDNIAAFGGDPANVTLFGESAGSAAVACLIAMPAARGLFARAIQQSGVGRAGPPERAAEAADALLANLGLDRARAGELAHVPGEKLLEAQAAVARRGGLLGFGPVRDAATLPDDPVGVVRSGGAADIPLMIGSNRDEVKLFTAALPREPLSEDGLAKAVREALPKADEAAARQVIEAFRASRTVMGLPVDNLDILDAVQSEARFHGPTRRYAAAQAAHQPKTFVYLFDHASPARRGALGACHALEMPFVFGTIAAPGQERFCGTGPEIERLSAEMMDAWIAFARTGDPSHGAIGASPTYDATARPTMVFGTRGSSVQDDPLSAERRAAEPWL